MYGKRFRNERDGIGSVDVALGLDAVEDPVPLLLADLDLGHDGD